MSTYRNQLDRSDRLYSRRCVLGCMQDTLVPLPTHNDIIYYYDDNNNWKVLFEKLFLLGVVADLPSFSEEFVAPGLMQRSWSCGNWSHLSIVGHG